MVDIKTAVYKAEQFALASLVEERTMGMRLEEVESSTVDSTAVWRITLSNLLVDDGYMGRIPAVAMMLGADPSREYKTFTVTKDTGEVLSMKIRMLAIPAAL